MDTVVYMYGVKSRLAHMHTFNAIHDDPFLKRKYCKLSNDASDPACSFDTFGSTGGLHSVSSRAWMGYCECGRVHERLSLENWQSATCQLLSSDFQDVF